MMISINDGWNDPNPVSYIKKIYANRYKEIKKLPLGESSPRQFEELASLLCSGYGGISSFPWYFAHSHVL